jgi:hypothetical protein
MSLYSITGVDAIGAIACGFAALGRDVSRTAHGSRLRRGIEAGRAGINGNALWKTLRFDDWLSTMSPAPVLDELRNNLALLLAGDLEQAMETIASAVRPSPQKRMLEKEADQATFEDFLLGLWAFSMEVVGAIEAMAGPTTPAEGTVISSSASHPHTNGPVLR